MLFDPHASALPPIRSAPSPSGIFLVSLSGFGSAIFFFFLLQPLVMMVVWCRHLYLRCVQLEILFVWCSNCCPHMILVISLWVFVDRGRMLPPDRINLLSVTCLLTIKFMLINQQFQVDRVRMYFLFISFQFDTLCPYCFEFSRCLIWYPCPALFPEDRSYGIGALVCCDFTCCKGYFSKILNMT